MDYASEKQIRRLYALLYRRGLNRSCVADGVKNICRSLGVLTIGALSVDEVKKAYKLVDKVDKFGQLSTSEG